ncbi:hypothetical protein [Jiangella asiatica]|uniref:Uncharacterized protein n=1 Tax=Jiangella asiatica TaxID=2530372 RepID=A0A4R5CFJ3_9ACTN|nr:hypothetical protein [Jiangella asiatica]TDD98888.1 hypothetical protein E1269_28195 [Jiangella asiatica]
MTTNTVARTASVARVRETPLLRWVLELDGVGTGLNGLAYLVAAGWIGDRLGLPTALLYPAGAFLVLAGAVLVALSTRRVVPVAWLWGVVAINAVWVVDSVVVAAAGWFDLTTAGTVWVLAQAALVAGFAVVETVAIRRVAG